MMQGLIVAVVLLLVMSGPGRAEEAVTPLAGKVNPHGDKGNCEVCHVASEADLNNWFTSGSTKKKLRKDFNALCRQCHGVEFGHGVGKRPDSNQEGLPMDADGKVACAVTCHSMHVKSDDPVQGRYHLRFPVNRLCLSCHSK